MAWNQTAMDVGIGQGFGSAGGGFLSMPGNFGSPSASQGEKRGRVDKLYNVVPVTVAQILKAPDTDELLKIGSLTAHTLTVVGIVRTVDEQSTKISYQLDDMTGPPLEVQMWLGDKDDYTSEKRTSIMENSYVRVTGTIRSVKGKRLLIAFKVSPVLDLNEVTMHLLEVIHSGMAAAMIAEQGSGVDDSNTTQPNTSNVGGNFSFAGGNVATMMGFSKPQQLVYQAISAATGDSSVSFQDLLNKLPSMGRPKIKEVLEFLSNEGHIYSTIADDHFKATDST